MCTNTAVGHCLSGFFDIFTLLSNFIVLRVLARRGGGGLGNTRQTCVYITIIIVIAFALWRKQPVLVEGTLTNTAKIYCQRYSNAIEAWQEYRNRFSQFLKRFPNLAFTYFLEK